MTTRPQLAAELKLSISLHELHPQISVGSVDGDISFVLIHIGLEAEADNGKWVEVRSLMKTMCNLQNNC